MSSASLAPLKLTPSTTSSSSSSTANPSPSPTPSSPTSTQNTLIVGTLNLSLRVRYGMTSRHVPLYLFSPYDPTYPSYRVASSTTEKENHVALIEPYHSPQAAAAEEGGEAAGSVPATSVAIPRGTLVRLLGPSGNREAEAQALQWQAVPFPPYPDPSKAQGEWLAQELQAVSQLLAAGVADPSRTLLDWPATFNIDNATTLDIDDVISVRRSGSSSSSSGWDFAITIADVAACIRPDSQLDRLARQNGQTLYSAEGVALRPMLPHQLATQQCSLVPGAPRLGVTLFLHWDGSTTSDGSGITCSGDFVPTLLHNRLSLAYDTAAAAGAAAGLGAELGALGALAGQLGRRLGVADRDLAADPHTWIEACMLFYNVAAGRRVRALGAGVLRRHGAPTLARIAEYTAVDAALSYLAYESASYVPASEGECRHYGLSADVYAHASSPIRRYSDLYNQRVLVARGGAGGAVEAAAQSGSGSGSAEPGELCSWLNLRARSLKRYSYDAFFQAQIEAASLIKVGAVFLRFCLEAVAPGEEGGESPDEDEGAGGAGSSSSSSSSLALPPTAAGGGGGAGGAGQGGAASVRPGRVQRRAEFWAGDWKRIVRLRLSVVGEQPPPDRQYTILTKDESRTYVLKPGTPVTLTAFANLRSKQWKKSMVFSCTPAQ